MRKSLIVCMMAILFNSCGHEGNEPPGFTAIGFWKENTALGTVGIVNRPDGTSRLYILDKNDTAEATHKYDGHYTVHGNKFRFQTDDNPEGIDICLETTHDVSGTMAGELVTRSFSQLAVFKTF